MSGGHSESYSRTPVWMTNLLHVKTWNFMAIFSGMEIIWDRQFGFLKETLVAPVSRLHIMLGKTLGGATVATLQGIIVFLIALAIGFQPNMISLPLAILFMILIAVLFTAIGIAIASLLDDMQGFQLIMNFLVMPIFFLSGALFPLQGLPKALQTIISINPLAYGVDGLRGTLVNGAHFGLFTDFMILGLIAALFLAIGSYLFSKIEI